MAVVTNNGARRVRMSLITFSTGEILELPLPAYSQPATSGCSKGIVLFPDHYVLPTLEHTTITWDDINEENSPGVILHWDDWGKMEAAGAVFLPSAGYREGNEVTLDWEYYPEGYYWTSTEGSGGNADSSGRALEFGKCQTDPDEYSIEMKDTYRHVGFSVRLIGPWIDNQ